MTDQGWLGRQCAQGSAITAFNHLAGKRCLLHRQGLSSAVCEAVVVCLRLLQQKFTRNVGKNGQVGVLERVY